MLLRETFMVLVLAVAIVTSCATVHGGRPLTVDDASPVAVNHLELELGLSGNRPHTGGRERAWPVIGLAYGLYPQLEMGMTIQRIDRDGRGEARVDGFEDLHLTSKYRIVDETALLPAFALDLDIKLPTANRNKNLSTGKSDQSLKGIASKRFDSVAAHVNFAYTLVQSPAGDKLQNRFFGGLATEWTLGPS